MTALNLTRQCLERWATDPAHADRAAFTFAASPRGTAAGEPDLVLSFAEVWRDVTRIGRGLLARGLQPGDRVLVRLPHCPDYAFAFLGATVAGLVPVPTSPELTPGEAAFLIADAEPRAVVADADQVIDGFSGVVVERGELATLDGDGPLPETSAEQPAYLIYTSGSTAKPKGVVHAHRTVLARRLMRDGWQGFTPADRTLHAGTLNWSYTLGVGLLDAWAAGAHAHLVAHPVTAADWPAVIHRLGITVFSAVPTVYRQILGQPGFDPAALGSLRHGLTAGESLPPALLSEWRRRTGKELYEALGMTEISTYVSSSPTVPVKPGAVGVPQAGRRVAVLRQSPGDASRTDGTEMPRGEVGLLAVHRSDPGLMLGYWRRPAEEAQVLQGEWFVGGDLASMDSDGYVTFAGRADDLIDSFGHRLSPLEIETIMADHPSVHECAAVAVRLGDAKNLLGLAVVTRTDASFDEAALREHAVQHLATYKRPHLYRLVDHLPRTRNGKIQRRVLAELLAAGNAAG